MRLMLYQSAHDQTGAARLRDCLTVLNLCMHSKAEQAAMPT